jgi:two-component sensor histidine kinase
MSVSTFVAPESMELVKSAIRANQLTAYEHVALRKDGTRFAAEIRARPMIVEGRVVRVTAVRDVTERKEAEEQLRNALHEKEVMLKEIHHRVKNNMQVVSSLLNLQASHVEDARTRELLNDSQLRIRSMALVHEKLYRSVNLAQVDFAEYLRSVTSELIRSYARPGVSYEVEAETHFMGVDSAVPCGLIVNELVTNALKHAFPGGREGMVRVALRRAADGTMVLAVADNGIGFPVHEDFRAMRSMGMTLLVSLSGQIGAEVSLQTGKEGTEFVVLLPP